MSAGAIPEVGQALLQGNRGPCAIVELVMGAGTWATVALEQSLPYFGVALADTRYHDHTGKSCPVRLTRVFRRRTRHSQNLSEPFRAIWC